MQEPLGNTEPHGGKRRISPITLIMAVVALLAIALSVWLLFVPAPEHKRGPGPTTVNLKMTPPEQEYAQNIQVGNITMSRAENFLHQEVTTLSGEVYNGGPKQVSGLRVTAEFFDSMNQVVLRETRAVLGTPEQPLQPGERRAFEIAFEHVPDSWNMQQPSVRVAYLQLPVSK